MQILVVIHLSVGIGTTQNGFIEDRDKCLNEGMNNYMSEPTQIGELQNAHLKTKN
jgi:hypothetical protein